MCVKNAINTQFKKLIMWLKRLKEINCLTALISVHEFLKGSKMQKWMSGNAMKLSFAVSVLAVANTSIPFV